LSKAAQSGSRGHSPRWVSARRSGRRSGAAARAWFFDPVDDDLAFRNRTLGFDERRAALADRGLDSRAVPEAAHLRQGMRSGTLAQGVICG
jgi:hypothetical protein